MLRTALAHQSFLRPVVAPLAGTFGSSGANNAQQVRGKQTALPVVDPCQPLPPSPYSPFGTKQKSMGEWTVARLDDLLNWGRKGETGNIKSGPRL